MERVMHQIVNNVGQVGQRGRNVALNVAVVIKLAPELVLDVPMNVSDLLLWVAVVTIMDVMANGAVGANGARVQSAAALEHKLEIEFASPEAKMKMTIVATVQAAKNEVAKCTTAQHVSYYYIKKNWFLTF